MLNSPPFLFFNIKSYILISFFPPHYQFVITFS
nr:MAG TPA: hypothetical protein [Caudoviricetes sp.]